MVDKLPKGAATGLFVETKQQSGGIRGFSFVWSKNLPNPNYDNTQLMHLLSYNTVVLEELPS